MEMKSLALLILSLGIIFFGHIPAALAVQNEMSFDYFSQENGLPDNHIQIIYQDHEGWMWFGTSQGLSRFDGYEFTNYQHAHSDSLSLKGILVRAIFEDKKGNLWVGTENGGLNYFDRQKECFYHPYENNPLFKGRDVSINDILEDKAGNIWLGTNNNIYIIDKDGQLSALNWQTNGKTYNLSGEHVRIVQVDQDGNIWAGTNKGVFIVNPQNYTITPLKLPLTKGKTDEIWEIFRDKDGTMWIGTYSNGAFIVNPKTWAIKPLELKPEYERTETVRTISVDAFGNYWIGTRGGIYVYNRKNGTKAFYRHDDREYTSLINNSILDIFNDKRGETWIGTRGGLNLLAKSKQVFRNFSAHPSDKSHKFLNSGIVYALWMDSLKNIWIGTEDGGVNIYHPKTGRYSYLMTQPGDPQSISRNCVKAFLDDKKGHLWIGTFLGGIDVLDKKTGKVIQHYQHEPSDSRSLTDNKVFSLLLDNKGNIWVGTMSGIDRFDPKRKVFVHYPQLAYNKFVRWVSMDSSNNIWLGTEDEVVIYNPESKKIKRFSDNTQAFLEDSRGRCWLATLDRGLAQYSRLSGPIRYYGVKDGLTNNQALCILEDDNHKLWISTSNGLSKFNPETGVFHNYTSKDGLINNQFSYGAAYKASDGDLLFGGISGFNMFNPADVKIDDKNVPLVLTSLKVFNKNVKISSGKKAILKKSISETKHLTLHYNQNVFTLEFAALNYINSKSNLYSYYLEGFDKNWSDPGINRTATYTNLDPGDYTLHIKRVVPGVKNNASELNLKLTILPPYWKTVWFRILILITIGALIYLLIRFFIYREKIKNELVIERVKARKIRELDSMKLKFFTNISHEIRTPLTLIMAPLEKLKNEKVPQQELKNYLDVMYRNTTHLNRLINQLLDFRKLESGNLKLELSQGDIVRFAADIVHSFDGLAEDKEIDLRYNALKKRLVARFDADKIEKILNNLLSNAFKFTNKGGKITVNLSLVFDSDEDDLTNENPDKEYIEFSVRDNGQGISQSNAAKIFDRFFQSSNDKAEQTGTGIGLAYVKELVQLHKGKIFLVSKPGKGSKFTVRIPYEKEIRVSEYPKEITSPENTVQVPVEKNAEQNLDPIHSNILLVVEDNPDVRNLIAGHFTDKYRVIQAKDGKEGWKVTLDTVPDVIISDVLMPDMDGFEFCRKVKLDERTSHIPILLLTALHSKEHEMKGLSAGADDYITKPFDLAILQTKIENMLSVRNSLKEKYSGEITLQPRNIVISSPDEKFLHKAVEAVESNISDAELDIERFAQEVGVSRMQLYRKLHALTDMTVKEFIRNIRLKRASQLLQQNGMTVSEIAYAVGFKDLSHFRKCFRQQYGMNATEYRQKHESDIRN
ncbi:hybrid sensor histidine kinase/response regulator [Prolixibacter bellariivorans]|uniref:histidine kinase n=1 Tax=Prolixibacter bellariivorans TaxID=314319 RepID=A0A5M4AYG5_9BACT|nr:two-component regulator propeller domain-containing protein [Prolixibacter bellariivorans]GET32497.1 hybrid sensor histidine kinase/response regulator [Prolixibacter bellariivorans]